MEWNLKTFRSYLKSLDMQYDSIIEVKKGGFMIIGDKPKVDKAFSTIDKLKSGKYQIILYNHDIENQKVAREFFV